MEIYVHFCRVQKDTKPVNKAKFVAIGVGVILYCKKFEILGQGLE